MQSSFPSWPSRFLATVGMYSLFFVEALWIFFRAERAGITTQIFHNILLAKF
jgi:hypothetical protein